jgi:glycosyltransferase involved in cell wall biosynthesis
MKKMLNVERVSVVIPCRNEENTIDKALDSLYNQRFDGIIEVLISDGMSTDRTIPIIRGKIDFFKKNPKGINGATLEIHLLENENRTASYGLDMGIKRAKGSVIIFLSAHSYAPEDFIKTNLDTLSDDIDACGD